MKRFTQYLYEYQKEKRIRNIGFVKVEQRGKSSVLQMQGRGIAVKSNEELKIYLFYKTGERYEAVYQGAISKKTPILSCTLEFTAEDIGNAETMEDIAGILLLEPDGKRYAAVWNGEAIDVEGISTEMKRVEPKSEDVQKREPEAEPVQTQEPEVLEAAEVAEEEEVLQIQVEETPGPKNICEKIQRKDLARLPRRDWRLANNNFLLHGFYNYHHLLWIEEDGELYIGVPGVNHARELQAAQAFGFATFRHLGDMKLELAEDEVNSREDFGYFCRRIGKTNESGREIHARGNQTGKKGIRN